MHHSHRYIYMHSSTKVFLAPRELSSCIVGDCFAQPPPMDVDEEKMLANYVPVFVMLPVRP